MRIGLISDLHIDINKDYPIVELTAETAAEQMTDVLVIAGDISETQNQTLQAIERLQSLCEFPVYYVPGNHDMWNKNCPECTTEEIDRIYREDLRCLSGKPVILEKDGRQLALVGDVGWYDYSMASPEYSRDVLDGMMMDGRTWQDKLYNQWTEDNQKQMFRCLKQLEKQLKYPVRYAVCGHVHYRSTVERDGIRHICPCLGYHTEWPLYHLADERAQTHIRDALYILETP